MKIILLPLFLLLGFLGHAQKETLNTIDIEGVTSIEFSADEIFKIIVTTVPGERVTIRTRSDGEYYNRISLDWEIVDETLFLSSRFRSRLQSGYDKLSAHKVFSIEVILEIPEDLNLDISSNLSSVYASGKYKNVLIQLKSGSCYLDSFSADATINTYNGNILVQNSNASVTADSRHGKIVLPERNSGWYKLILSSINGDIKVVNSK